MLSFKISRYSFFILWTISHILRYNGFVSSLIVGGSQKSFFLGNSNNLLSSNYDQCYSTSSKSSLLVMRKQKASDKRTRRRQMGIQDDTNIESMSSLSSYQKSTTTTTTTNNNEDRTVIKTTPMTDAEWNQKKLYNPSVSSSSSSSSNNIQRTRSAIVSAGSSTADATRIGGRGRSRKRSAFYNLLSVYHTTFLGLLTAEFRAEVSFLILKIGIFKTFRNIYVSHYWSLAYLKKTFYRHYLKPQHFTYTNTKQFQ